MTAGNFIKKGIMPLILMGILTWLGQYIYMENGCVDWLRFILVYARVRICHRKIYQLKPEFVPMPTKNKM